jgi:nitrilase
MIISPWGSILSQVDEGEGIALAEIDMDYLKEIRIRMPIREQQKL